MSMEEPFNPKLKDRICVMCQLPFSRHGWEDHRQYCPNCLKFRNKRNSKRWADLHFLRWIPDHLRDKIPNIEEEL